MDLFIRRVLFFLGIGFFCLNLSLFSQDKPFLSEGEFGEGEYSSESGKVAAVAVPEPPVDTEEDVLDIEYEKGIAGKGSSEDLLRQRLKKLEERNKKLYEKVLLLTRQAEKERAVSEFREFSKDYDFARRKESLRDRLKMRLERMEDELSRVNRELTDCKGEFGRCYQAYKVARGEKRRYYDLYYQHALSESEIRKEYRDFKNILKQEDPELFELVYKKADALAQKRFERHLDLCGDPLFRPVRKK